MADSDSSDKPPDPQPPLNVTRRRLCSAAPLALMVTACGGSDYNPPPPPPPPPPAPAPAPTPSGVASCGATAISANHGHELVIPAADLDSTISITYNITGTADHNHTIVLSPGQLAQIKAKTAVTVNSSVDVGHFHELTVNCP